MKRGVDEMAKKVFVVAFGLLLIYAIGSTCYIISARANFRNQLDDSIRKVEALNAELGRARTLIDSTSLGLERTIGRVSQIQDRNTRIIELINGCKSAISGLMGYIASVQGEAPNN